MREEEKSPAPSPVDRREEAKHAERPISPILRMRVRPFMVRILTTPPPLCHLRKRPILLPYPHEEKRPIRHRENESRHPCSEYERETKYLHDDHDIVRVRKVFVRPAPHEPLTRHDEYPRVPPIPERGDRPITNDLREKK